MTKLFLHIGNRRRADPRRRKERPGVRYTKSGLSLPAFDCPSSARLTQGPGKEISHLINQPREQAMTTTLAAALAAAEPTDGPDTSSAAVLVGLTALLMVGYLISLLRH
jgi:hypothetical protein